MLGGTGAAAPVADDRFALFDATLQYLTAAAHHRPVVVVLEDLHGADQPSLNLLVFIASNLAGTSLAVLGTYRTTEARMTPEVGAILDRLARAGRVIAPRRLDPLTCENVHLAAEHTDVVWALVGGFIASERGLPGFYLTFGPGYTAGFVRLDLRR